MGQVFVGLSGGVDSAVSAALLKEHGHEVVGCFIKIWQPEFIECTWREERLDAMRVAAALGIPFREVDLSEEYRKEVVEHMVGEYATGATPNPDVLCNEKIKFGHFLEWALAKGAEKVATGHYARIEKHPHNDLRCRYGCRYGRCRYGRFSLLRGTDQAKDQSYFLHRLSEEELARTLFPVGEYTKAQIRALAKKYGLPNAEKPDSQGFCFVGDVAMDKFLTRFIPLKQGEVLDSEGVVVGKHKGAALYTVGQRHGFLARAGGEAQYVISVDTRANTITVSPERERAAVDTVLLSKVHWVNEAPTFPFFCEAQARYRETPVRVRIEKSARGTRVHFEKPHIASPGQSLVLYHGDECLGGGVIEYTPLETQDGY